MKRIVAIVAVIALMAGPALARTSDECAAAKAAYWTSPSLNTLCIWSIVYDMFGSGGDPDGLGG